MKEQSQSCLMEWQCAQSGFFSLVNGELESIHLLHGSGGIEKNRVNTKSNERLLLQLRYSATSSRYGKKATIIRWHGEKNPFSFIPAHLVQGRPIRIPDFGVTIGLAEQDLLPPPASHPDTIDNQDIPRGEEICWDTWASRNNIPRPVPTVLGLSRDQRFFVVDPSQERMTACVDLTLPQIVYVLNRSSHATDRCTRHLEQGYLPILHSHQRAGSLRIEDTWFVTLGDRPLTEENVTGTPLNISHLFSGAGTFPPGIKEIVEQQANAWTPEGEVVIYLRTRIINESATPCLTSHKIPTPASIARNKGDYPTHCQGPLALQEDGTLLVNHIPLSLHRINGKAPECLQPALLLQPGEELVMDSILSHRLEGLSAKVRATGIDWDAKLSETKAFWEWKIQQATQIILPEKRLENFWKAGQCHLQLTTLGQQTGPLLAKVGCYSAIGSESIPIIEFYDSIGLHDDARRCIDAFLDLQWSNGRINLFAHYDLETGGVLYLSGLHYRYTKDKQWVIQRKESFQRAADYILSLRQLEHPDQPDYGLIAGTCADPLDKMTSFMLNAYNISGLLALAYLFHEIQDEKAAYYQQQADALLVRFQQALNDSFAKGPILPVTPDRWIPTCAPWIEGTGLQAMGLNGETCYTHRTSFAYDSMISPLYATYMGLIEPNGQQAQWMLEVAAAHLHRSTIAESQPYYSRHPEIHLLRGERESFLNAFYSGLTALADRETFSFWEHLYEVSIHKTHEEGWALMQLRRMLWIENGDVLHLLQGIPQDWSHHPVEVHGAMSYFGKLSFQLVPDQSGWTFHWDPAFHTTPKSVVLHLNGYQVSTAKQPRIRFLTTDSMEILSAEIPLTLSLQK